MAASGPIRGLDPKQPRISFCRKAAQRMLRDYDVTEPPVPVELIAQRLGLSVAVTSLPSGVDGRLDTATSIVHVAEGQASVRHRFTIAHELGHLVLQHHRQETDVAETEANQFAGALLLPAGWLRSDLKKSPTPSIDDLAQRYDVSESVIFIAAKDARVSALLRR